MLYKLEWTSFSKDDYDSLDGSERIIVDKGLAKIRSFGLDAGKPLSGALAACRKIKHKRHGIRIIFRESPNGVQIIQIVVIGKRERLAAYETAKKRLKE